MTCKQKILLPLSDSLQCNLIDNSISITDENDALQSSIKIEFISDAVARVRVNCNTTKPLSKTYSILPIDEKLGRSRDLVGGTLLSKPSQISTTGFDKGSTSSKQQFSIQTSQLKVLIDEKTSSLQWLVSSEGESEKF
jgi:hypothetical protein